MFGRWLKSAFLVIIVGYLAMLTDMYYGLDGNFSIVCAIATATGCLVYVIDNKKDDVFKENDENSDTQK